MQVFLIVKMIYIFAFAFTSSTSEHNLWTLWVLISLYSKEHLVKILILWININIKILRISKIWVCFFKYFTVSNSQTKYKFEKPRKKLLNF